MHIPEDLKLMFGDLSRPFLWRYRALLSG